ncbi:MAG: helix-hairpin-helix domain-containing protein [Lachnospiraceae bacterium]|nr:helix-hairpin-helix domain-containing protein [Lachnospiraceae bacterium]
MRDQSEQTIQILYHAAIDGDRFTIEKILESVDLDDIAEEFIQQTDKSGLDYLDLLSKFLQVTHYLENSTSIPTTLTDQNYDVLIETFKDVGGDFSDLNLDDGTTGTGTAEHQYPELRGTLNKVHFITNAEIPEHDSRKSLESWWNKIWNELELPDNMKLEINADMKYDGHSVVFEMRKNRIHKALTRYRTDINLGKDITHIFKGWDANDLKVPEEFQALNQYGVKTEVYMAYDKLKEFQTDTGDLNCNHRSAVSSILGRKNAEQDLLNYLSVEPFQIATNEKVSLKSKNSWVPAGIIHERHQYIQLSGWGIYNDDFGMGTFEVLEEPFTEALLAVKDEGNEQRIPIDGMVITIISPKIIKMLGRKNNINQFQIAYKFPSAVGKTTLKKVTFPVGPCAGAITPLAELEPIQLDGKTIKSASLSNMEKLERLDLRIGDEVIIKYDIIPKLYKDETCRKGTGPKVATPNVCPVCGGELSETYRCMNADCPSKIPGKIYNYVSKMRIPNIGKKLIEKLVATGIWSGIHSLYRMPQQQNLIITTPGVGEKLYQNMLSGVYNRTEVYPHEVIGAIGIPDISVRTAMKVFKSVDFLELTRPSKSDEERMAMLTSIKGIGEKKATKMLTGIRENEDLLAFLGNQLTILPYEDTGEETPIEQNVVFTNVRDKSFEDFLVREKNIGVSNTVSSKTVAVITQNEFYQKMMGKWVKDTVDEANSLMHEETPLKKTAKVKAAEEKGIPIIGINEYKKRMGYEK